MMKSEIFVYICKSDKCHSKMKQNSSDIKMNIAACMMCMCCDEPVFAEGL